MTPPSRDLADAVVVKYRSRGERRRVVFEPQTDGWERIEEVWTGNHWRPTGSELVHDLDLEQPIGTSYAGP